MQKLIETNKKQQNFSVRRCVIKYQSTNKYSFKIHALKAWSKTIERNIFNSQIIKFFKIIMELNALIRKSLEIFFNLALTCINAVIIKKLLLANNHRHTRAL